MPKNIPVMLSRSSKGEHYNGLGGVCKGGTVARERLRQTEGEWHGRLPCNKANPATTNTLRAQADVA